MVYYLFVTIFLAFEFQKLFQFNFFFRLKSISSEYTKKLAKRTNSIAYKQLTKIAFVDLAYLIVLLIGLFTFNRYFFCIILVLSALQTLIFKIKNKTFKKIWFIIDIILSISLLTLALINFSYFQLDDIQFIRHLFKF